MEVTSKKEDEEFKEEVSKSSQVPIRIRPSSPVRKRPKWVTKKITPIVRAKETCHVLKGKDACSTFGEHVANELRNFGKATQAVVKHKISTVLYEAAIGMYERSFDGFSGTSFAPRYSGNVESVQGQESGNEEKPQFSPPSDS